MEHNYLKEFEKGPPKEYFFEVWLKSNQQFLRRCFLKEKFTDARTDKWTDRLTDGTFAEACEKSSCGFGKKSCVSTGVRKPGNKYASPTAMI